MFEAISATLIFIQQYVITAVYAIGVIFFLYGIVNSFMLGRADLGHPYLLRSFVVFIFALLLYGATALLLWFGTLDVPANPIPRQESDERTPSVLPTPNVPVR